MRTKNLIAIVMLVALVVLGPAMPARATAQETDPIGVLKRLPGLEAAYARKYISAEMVAPPGAATPATSRDHHLVVTATALEFRSAISLALAKRVSLNDTTIRQMLGEPTGTITQIDASSIGVDATIYLVRTDIGDGQAHALLMATKDKLGFLIRADGPEAALKPALVAIGAFMIHAKPGSGDEAPQPPAESTGGLWDLFPSASDTDVLQGLVPMYDYDLLGPTGESPIGSATPVS